MAFSDIVPASLLATHVYVPASLIVAGDMIRVPFGEMLRAGE